MAVPLHLPLSEEMTGLKDSQLYTSEGPAVVVVILIRVESNDLDPSLYHHTPTKISAPVVSLTCKVTDGSGTVKQNLIDYYNDYNKIILCTY